MVFTAPLLTSIQRPTVSLGSVSSWDKKDSTLSSRDPSSTKRSTSACNSRSLSSHCQNGMAMSLCARNFLFLPSIEPKRSYSPTGLKVMEEFRYHQCQTSVEALQNYYYEVKQALTSHRQVCVLRELRALNLEMGLLYLLFLSYQQVQKKIQAAFSFSQSGFWKP